MLAAIFEPNHSGHRMNFVRLLVPALRCAGFAEIVLITTPEAVASEEYSTLVAANFSDLNILEIPKEGSASAAAFVAAILSAGPDRVYVPYADGLAQRLAIQYWCGLKKTISIPFEGLQLRGKIAYEPTFSRAGVHGRLSWMLSQSYPWDRLHQLDPWVSEATKNMSPRLPGLVMPDPVESNGLQMEEAREALDLPKSNVIIGAFGLLSSRKGIVPLVRAFASASTSGRHQLLLAGKLAEDAQEFVLVENAELIRDGRIRLIDRWLTDTELEAGLAACNWVSALYPRHIGSSSIVLRAAANGRPVIASSFGWVGRTVSTFGLGRTIDVGDSDLMLKELSSALDNPVELKRTEAVSNLLKFNSVENFQLVWAARASETAGINSAKPMHWCEVIDSEFSRSTKQDRQ